MSDTYQVPYMYEGICGRKLVASVGLSGDKCLDDKCLEVQVQRRETHGTRTRPSSSMMLASINVDPLQAPL